MNSKGEKPWLLEYSKLPEVTWHDDDHVTLHNIRYFLYFPDGRVRPGWYDTAFSLREVKSVDMILSYWGSPHIAHVFLSFELGNGQRVAFSVETRRREGQPWSAWRGFLQQYSVIYVAGDERDLIGQRLCVRGERVYLYPLSLSPAHAASLLRDYLSRIACISEAPEHYHTLWNNCTTNILRHGRSLSPEMKYHWQILLSGHADRYCYNRNLLDRQLPFCALKACSRLIAPQSGLIDSNFSHEIRQQNKEISESCHKEPV